MNKESNLITMFTRKRLMPSEWDFFAGSNLGAAMIMNRVVVRVEKSEASMLSEWCENNCKHTFYDIRDDKWGRDSYFYFASKSDLAMFVLHWKDIPVSKLWWGET